MGTSPQKGVQLFQQLEKIFEGNCVQRSTSVPFWEEAVLYQLGPWYPEGWEQRNPTCLASAWVSSINCQGADADALTPHSSQLKNSVERSLKSFLCRGLTVLSGNRNQEGAIVAGVGRKQGRKRAWERTGRASGLLHPGLCLHGDGCSPLMEALWPSSMEVQGVEELHVFNPVLWNTPNTPLTFLLVVCLIKAVFFLTA